MSKSDHLICTITSVFTEPEQFCKNTRFLFILHTPHSECLHLVVCVPVSYTHLDVYKRQVEYLKEEPVADTSTYIAKLNDYDRMKEEYKPYVLQAYAKGRCV